MSSRSSTDHGGISKAGGSRGGEEWILVGRVRRPHGVRGAVMVESFTDNPHRFDAGSRLRTAGGAILTVATAQPHRGALLVSFGEVSDRDAAEALRGTDLEVPESAVPEPEEGTWYQYQLVGCRCRDLAQGVDLGRVVDVVEDGGGLLLVVEGEDGRRLPVPFVRRFLRRVDVEAGEIDFELPAGLAEACAT